MGSNQPSRRERQWEFLFKIGIALKGFNGLWEVVGGCLLFFAGTVTLSKMFYSLVAEELLEDPHDFLVNLIGRAIEGASADTKIFVAIYILIHGMINIFLAVQLYRKKLWAYMFSISLMSLFLIYQIYRIFLYRSATLLAVTILDIIFILLTRHEYVKEKRRQIAKSEAA